MNDTKLPIEEPLSHETPPDLVRSHEAEERQGQQIQIPEHQQISVMGALSLATGEGLEIGKSTLQRKVKKWYELGEAAEVPCVLVTSKSVQRYVLQREAFVSWVLDELTQQKQVGTSPGLVRSQEVSKDDGDPRAPEPETDRYVTQLETRLEEKNDEIKFLRAEVSTKNDQLSAASERDRETNVLIQGVQSMVLKLTGKDTPKTLPGSPDSVPTGPVRGL